MEAQENFINLVFERPILQDEGNSVMTEHEDTFSEYVLHLMKDVDIYI